jgi:hypothetical protein
MKRLLLSLTGVDSSFTEVDFQWAELHKRLLAACASTDQRLNKLRKTLECSEKHHLREQRHTAVHGSWWVYAGCGARVSRWPRKQDDRIIAAPDLQHWERIARMCWEFAPRLDELLGEDWPRAMLPDRKAEHGILGTPQLG